MITELIKSTFQIIKCKHFWENHKNIDFHALEVDFLLFQVHFIRARTIKFRVTGSIPTSNTFFLIIFNGRFYIIYISLWWENSSR